MPSRRLRGRRRSFKNRRMTAAKTGSPRAVRRAQPQAFDLAAYLASRTAMVNKALDGFLPSPETKPATIHKAMRYSLFAGGKRLRPALCLAAAAACGGEEVEAMPLACAVEC